MKGTFDRKAYWEARILAWERFRYSRFTWLWPPAWPLRSRLRAAVLEAMRFLPEGGSVLELGCGSGLFAAALEHRAGSFVGIDLSEAAVQKARRRVPRFEFRQGDVLTAELPRADLVVFLGLLDWLTAEEAAHLFSKLQGQTLLFSFTVPGGFGPYRLYRRFVDRKLGRDIYRGRSWEPEAIEALAGSVEIVHCPWWNPGRLAIRKP